MPSWLKPSSSAGSTSPTSAAPGRPADVVGQRREQVLGEPGLTPSMAMLMTSGDSPAAIDVRILLM